MKRRMHVGAAILFAVVAIMGSTGARAGHSGGGGFAVAGETAGCDLSPECRAFSRACLPELAMREGVTSSVVNIRHIAGDSKSFRLRGTLPPTLGGLHIGAVDLLDSSCHIIPNAGIGISPGVRINGSSRTLSISSRAHWMAVTAIGGSRDVTWTLT